jgi:protein SCO1
MVTRLSLALIAASLLGSTVAVAHPQGEGGDAVMAPPPSYKGNDVAIKEHLGAKIPLDARFRTQDGKQVTLGELVGGDVPTILTFNYSDCPVLCSLQLNGLSAAMPKAATPAPMPGAGAKDGNVGFRVGIQYRIVTIDLEPNEPLEKLQKMREKYLERLPSDERDAARAGGWTFLVAEKPGDGAAIRRVAQTVGFSYTYLPERAEWAHPAALIFLSSAGAVTRYVYGIEFETAMLRESIFKAGQAEPATAVGFMNRCYHYDPDANSHAHAGVVAMRVGAAAFMVLLISAFGLWHFMKKRRQLETE